MTAEIALLNKEAVALAADSAVTLSLPNGQQKILPSANKIFTLSKFEPVGVMIYGNAQLLGVPWEVVIKDYRQRLAKQSFATLSEYAAHFLDFLSKSRAFFPDERQDHFFLMETRLFFGEIVKQYNRVRSLCSSRTTTGRRPMTPKHMTQGFEDDQKPLRNLYPKSHWQEPTNAKLIDADEVVDILRKAERRARKGGGSPSTQFHG
jgi:hypothetical protein